LEQEIGLLTLMKVIVYGFHVMSMVPA
jgi:hypothetical protein